MFMKPLKSLFAKYGIDRELAKIYIACFIVFVSQFAVDRGLYSDWIESISRRLLTQCRHFNNSWDKGGVVRVTNSFK